MYMPLLIIFSYDYVLWSSWSMINNILAMAKKNAHLMSRLPAADEEEKQAFGYHLLLDEIIMVLKRRIEDEEVAY